LTIPAYTPPAVAEPTGRAASRHGLPPSDTGHRWSTPLLRRLAQVRASPRSIQVALDVGAVGFIVLAFTDSTLSAEFLFHCVFVLLVLHAFMFGRFGTFLRIALVSIPLLIYAESKFFGLVEPELELTEWPLMFVIAGLVAWMADRRNATSREYATLFRRASERLLTVEEDERRRIAGELHDGVGQVLTALTLTLDATASTAERGVMQRRLVDSRNLADTALAGVRDLSHRIRPTRLEERGLVASVRDLASQSGFPVVVHADEAIGDPRLLGATATVEIYRIIQEALANAARHSGASKVHVWIAHREERLTVVVADEGHGFDPAAVGTGGIGLAGMRERARLLGGQCSIESAPGAGTRVTVSFPMATLEMGT
jgi:signal transduction histidine kinase